jgi:hypothetical protein
MSYHVQRTLLPLHTTYRTLSDPVESSDTRWTGFSFPVAPVRHLILLATLEREVYCHYGQVLSDEELKMRLPVFFDTWLSLFHVCTDVAA